MSEQQTQLRRRLPLLPALLPPVFIGLSILKYGVDTPMWDEWLVGGYLEKFAHGDLTFADLFEQQNEYRQLFPNLIFVALGWLTRWDVRSWMLLSFLLAGLVSINIYYLGRWSLAAAGVRPHIIFFIANLIIFSPVQHENWLQGQQLIYFLPIACFTAALLVASAGKLRNAPRFGICALASTISSFSSANGMLCWILLLPVLAWSSSKDDLRRKRWWIVAWIVAFGLTLACYFYDYRTPPGNLALSWARIDPVKTSAFFLSVLGRPLTPARPFAAAFAGFVLLGLFVWCCRRFWSATRSRDFQARRMLCWLMLGAYSILTALLITTGRAGPDTTPVLTSRYTTFTLYLPVALIHLLPMAVAQGSGLLQIGKLQISRTQALRLAAIALVVLHVPIYLLGIRQMNTFRVMTLQAKACALFVNVVKDECFLEMVYPDLDTLKLNINAADRLGFIRPGLVKTNRIKEIENTQAQDQRTRGAFQSLAPVGGISYLASGSAILPDRGEPADAVLLVYEDENGIPIIFSIAPLATERDFVSAVLKGRVYGDPRWAKSFSLDTNHAHPTKFSAWGFDAFSGKAYKLDGQQVLQQSQSLGEK